MESVLSRKGKLLKNYSSHHYVLTPAGFLHEFGATESSKYGDPTMSLYIPECRIAAPHCEWWETEVVDHGQGYK